MRRLWPFLLIVPSLTVPQSACGSRVPAPANFRKSSVSATLPLELKGDIACRSPVSIHQVVRGRIGAVRYIVQKRSKEVPDLADWIKIRFTIVPSGAVGAVSFVGHGTGDRELDGQIKDKVRNWPFDPVEKGSVVVTYFCVLRDR